VNKKNKIHFEVSERKVLLRIFDVTFVVVALYIIGFSLDVVYLESSTSHFNYVLALAFYINIIGTVFEMYNLQVASNQFQILKSTILTVSVIFLFYLLTPVFSAKLPENRLQLLAFYFTMLFSLLIWRMFYVKFLASKRFEQKVVLICDRDQVEELIQGLENTDPHYKIIAFIDTHSSKNEMRLSNFVTLLEMKDLVSFVNKNVIFEIVIATQKTEDITVELYQKLIHLLEMGTTIREYTQVYENKTQRIPVHHITKDFYKFFPFNRSNNNQLYLLFIRIMEMTISVIGSVFGIMIIPFILIGNRIGNRGSLFYTQERVGKNGTIFLIYKFRTMVNNAEKGKPVYSSPNDFRVTSFGKFMRKTRIDEIPQFINILKGDMGIIGPRPERPFFVKEIAEIMPFYETRHIIKPGLSGWAQVNYSYGESIEDSLIKLQYDLYYIKHRSIFLDINIAIKTISTVLFYRGQ
jgi:exopolysaccharide biosynthesis polyprenyl glycosylphosphotransferase